MPKKRKDDEPERPRSLNSLPRWDDAWEQPDPLRGRHGWSLHHYVAVAVKAFLLLIVAFLILSPAIRLARQSEAVADRSNLQKQGALEPVLNDAATRP